MNSRSRNIYLLAAASLLFCPVLSADSTDVVDELKQCARITQQESRIDCYESLGRRVLGSEASEQGAAVVEPATPDAKPQVSAAAVAAVPSDKPEMNDQIGGYKFEEKPSDHPDNAIHARVVLCQRDRDKAWHFKFENGQVWKQVDRTTLNFQGCDFPVTILKDGFGYKMKIEGSERQIRISRRK